MKVILNPDKEKVKQIREKLKLNLNHCPCRLLADDNSLCPCLDFRETQECICQLFIKAEENND